MVGERRRHENWWFANGAFAPFEAIGKLVREWQPDALVVGLPVHPDGAPHQNTRRARLFSRELAERFQLPVHEVDERYTTTEASAERRRGDLDAAAAAIILEQFLRSVEISGEAAS